MGGKKILWGKEKEKNQEFEATIMNNREEDKGSCGERPRLPDPDELVPLTQALIPLGLASAFKIVTDTKPGNGSSKKLNGNGSSNNNNNKKRCVLNCGGQGGTKILLVTFTNMNQICISLCGD